MNARRLAEIEDGAEMRRDEVVMGLIFAVWFVFFLFLPVACAIWRVAKEVVEWVG